VLNPTWIVFCKVCGQSFRFPGNLRRHFLIEHKVILSGPICKIDWWLRVPRWELIDPKAVEAIGSGTLLAPVV
jgi:hypothetical protein